MAVAVLCAHGAPGAACAEPPGTITGVIRDALDRPLPGAAVRLEAGDGQVVQRTATDDQGRFSFTGVDQGTYAVIAEKEGFESATKVVTLSGREGGEIALPLTSTKALDVGVIAKRLEEARIGIQPRVGASTYELTNEAIQNVPRGDNNTLTDVLLRAPGVTQDSSEGGYIHVRNEHANVQYRINGVALPEGVSLFGQSGGLAPRLASKVDLITGALPAEFGLRTSGIVDVQTQSGAFEQGGYLGMYGGSFSWLQPSGVYSGSAGRFNYFVAGDYLQNGIGINPATPDHPIHDNTRQGHGFGYFEYLVDPSTRVSAIFGTFVGHFQIPNSPDQTPSFTVNGISDFQSANTNENQFEQNYYGVLSLLRAEGNLAYQVSVFSRYSTLKFTPDPLADLLFNGIAQNYVRSSLATGLQAEGSYILTPTHTLRGGFTFTADHTGVQTTSSVLPAEDGAQVSDIPFSIFQSTATAAMRILGRAMSRRHSLTIRRRSRSNRPNLARTSTAARSIRTRCSRSGRSPTTRPC